jgi:hypothetical protein
MEFVLHVVETEKYKFKQILVIRFLIMEEHKARDKYNNWQYENTVHLWIHPTPDKFRFGTGGYRHALWKQQFHRRISDM